MDTIFFFAMIGIMRVLQKICTKKVSNRINQSITFFHYGGYYQIVATGFSLITLCIAGFYGFNIPTLLCALTAAILFAVELFTSIEAVKGTTLVVCNMFSTGGLFIPCILGIFLFDEPMGLLQWLGLFVFILSIYFLSAKKEKSEKPFTVKTFIMLLLNMIANGLVMVVQKYFALLVPNGNVALYSALTFGLNAFILYGCMGIFLLRAKKKDIGEGGVKPLGKELLICGVLLALALFTINLIVTNLASTISSVVLFTVSSAITVIITCLVGALVFKEKLTVKNIFGLFLGFISIIMVNVL